MSRSVAVFVSLIMAASFGLAHAQVPTFTAILSDPLPGEYSNNPNLQIGIGFERPVVPAGVTLSTYVAGAVGQQIPVALTGSGNGYAIYATPLAPLADGEYLVDFSQVVSTDVPPWTVTGSSAYPDTKFTFKLDATPPVLQQSSPYDDQTGVPAGTSSIIVLGFSEPTDLGGDNPITLRNVTTGANIPVTYLPPPGQTIPTDQNVRRFLASLEPNTTYEVDFSTAKDAAANFVTGVTSITFQTVDTIPPTLVSSDPANGAVDVPRDTLITLTFSEPVDLPAGSSVLLTDPAGYPVELQRQASQSPDTLVFRPAALLAEGVTYTLNFSTVQDLAGNEVAGQSEITFTVVPPDTTPPVLVSSDPANGALGVPRNPTISLTFSEDVILPQGAVVTFSGPNGLINLSSLDSPSQDTLIFVPDALLQGGGVYTVNFSAVTDLAGNEVAGQNTITFTVTPPPTLVSSSPAAGSANVPIDTLIELVFDKPMNGPGSQVSVRNGGTVAGVLAPGTTNETLVFTPVAPFDYSTVYTVDFSGVQDTDGLAPAGTTSFSFTTEPRPPLVLVSSAPTNGAADVPIETAITLTTNYDLAPNASVSVTGGVQTVAGTTTVLGKTLTFVPTAPLAFETVYTVDLAGVRDIYGRSLTGSISFTTSAWPSFAVASSSPADGAAGVPVGSQLVVNASLNLASTSSIILRSRLETVPGTSSVVGNTITFTPNTALRFGTSYTADLSGVRDIYNRPLGGTLNFTTEYGDLAGAADPPVVRVSANQIAGVAYLVENKTSAALTLTSSQAEFVVDGNVVETAPVPVTLTVPPNNIASAASDVAVSSRVQELAREAGVDEVFVFRTFAAPAIGEAPAAQISIPLRIVLTGNLTGPASVTEILLDVPPEGKIVSRNSEIRAHGFIRGTGSGTVSGVWLVDNQPVESFQTSLVAGITQEVSTRVSLPTASLGGHRVKLVVMRPTLAESNETYYVVTASENSTQRVSLFAPRKTKFIPGIAPIAWKWLPMPGAAGYEIAFAKDPADLGATADAPNADSFLPGVVWTEQMAAAGRLALLIKLPADRTSWTPDAAEIEKLAGQSGETLYGAVRVIYANQAHGDPTTTSARAAVMVQAEVDEIALLSPTPEEKLQLPGALKWQPCGGTDVNYQIEIVSNGKTAVKALTRSPEYVLGRASNARLAAGGYRWRVIAMKPGPGIVAASKWAQLTLETAGQTDASSGMPAQSALLVSDGRFFSLLPGASDQVTFIPANGAVIADQQPTITVTYPKAKPETAALTLNGVDVTGLAAVSDTNTVLMAPGVFNEGQFSIGFSIQTEAGEQLEATSTFTVSLPLGSPAAANKPPAGSRPLVLQWDWNWQAGQSNDLSDLGNLVVGLNISGYQNWGSLADAYSALNAQLIKITGEDLDIPNLMAEASLRAGRAKAFVGDMGSGESDLTAGGLTYRAFNFVTDAGGVKLSAAHTLGRALQRSSTGRAPDMLLVTAENKGATAQRGVKFAYVDSKNSISGGSGFSGPSKSEVMSFSGRTNLGKSGVNLRMELSRSDSDMVTALGTSSSTGDALYAMADGKLAGFNMSASFRRIASDYTSPASQTLTNDLKGWTYIASRPFGRFLSAAVNYVTLDNGPSSSSPSSNVLSKSLDITAAYPNLPYLTLRLAKNKAASAPFVQGANPAENEDKQWSLSMNYARPKWNYYLSYGKSEFTDFFDFIDPATDTPNDRDSKNWAFGLGLRPSPKLRCRFDWGENTVDRWFRIYTQPDPLFGSDGSRQRRFSVDYLFNRKLSSTVEFAKWHYSAALGQYLTDNKDLRIRLNYLIQLLPNGGGLTLTGEWRKVRLTGTQALRDTSEYVILVNDSRLFAF